MARISRSSYNHYQQQLEIMNKTVSINIGSLFFHIDDNAYYKLNTYLDAIKSSLSEDSREEVMNDIEARIGEILSSRIQPDKQVINTLDIDYIISIMGQPEDYIIEDDEPKNNFNNYQQYNNTFSKKLFRDEDEGKIGGVCAGLGHYFGIDVIWMRIIFILALLITNGIGFIIYIGLWIMVPKAISTAEKLQMKGEAINISNIEKKVKEGYDKVANGITEFNNSDLKKNITNNSGKAVNAVENFAKKTLNVITKIIGIVLFITSLLSLGSLLIFCGMLILSSAFVINEFSIPNIPFEGMSLIAFGLLILLSAGIPLLFLFFLSLKILSPSLNFLGRYTILTLLALWVISLFGWVFFGLNQAFKEANTGTFNTKKELLLNSNDTLKVVMNNNSFYSVETDPSFSSKLVQNENGEKIIYSNRVEVVFRETEGKSHVVVEQKSKGKSIENAVSNAKDINYNIDVNNNTITLDNYFTSNPKSKNKNQRVNIYVYINKSNYVDLNKISRNYTENIGYTQNDNPIFKLNSYNTLECINCEESQNNTQALPTNLTQPTKLEREVDSILNAVN